MLDLSPFSFLLCYMPACNWEMLTNSISLQWYTALLPGLTVSYENAKHETLLISHAHKNHNNLKEWLVAQQSYPHVCHECRDTVHFIHFVLNSCCLFPSRSLLSCSPRSTRWRFWKSTTKSLTGPGSSSSSGRWCGILPTSWQFKVIMSLTSMRHWNKITGIDKHLWWEKERRDQSNWL